MDHKEELEGAYFLADASETIPPPTPNSDSAPTRLSILFFVTMRRQWCHGGGCQERVQLETVSEPNLEIANTVI